MDNLKDAYRQEIEKTVGDIAQVPHDFSFALLTDSHLDEGLSNTLCNIAAVDRQAHFDCAIHLGDFLTGNITRSYTKKLLQMQMQSFRDAVGTGVFYPVQGNHDGFLNNIGTSMQNIVLDEDWYEATAFVDAYPKVSRPGQMPYFFVDYPDKKLRLIILCTQYYKEGVDRMKSYLRIGVDSAQLAWLSQSALALESGWTVMVFSHDAPVTEAAREEGSPWGGTAVLDAFSEAMARGILVAGWFVGHHHGEYITKINGIPIVLIGSQTSYVPQLWQPANGAGFYYDRKRNTLTEDLWDAVALDMQARKVTLFRFGAGEDRSIFY